MEVVACPFIFTIPFLIQNLNSKKVCDGLTADIMQEQKDNIQFYNTIYKLKDFSSFSLVGNWSQVATLFSLSQHI